MPINPDLKDAHLEVLRDQKGPYGVGFDCIDTSTIGYQPVIIRPDRLAENCVKEVPRYTAAYQRIVSGWPFKNTREHELGATLHRAMLARAGLEYGGESQQDWWSSDKSEQAKNRRRYHGYKRMAFQILNHLIEEALSAGPQEALRATRRFPISERQNVYQIVARSNHALQLVETFPALLLAISGWQKNHDQAKVERAVTAFGLVQRGGAPESRCC